MSRDFAHVITPTTSRAAFPLTVEVRATFDNDGTMDRWGLVIQRHEQSPKNRDVFMRLLRGVRRDGMAGDYVVAKWETPQRLEIWEQHYHWNLSPQAASNLCDEIEGTVGRFAKQMLPPATVVPPPANDVTWQERRIAELQQELREARQMSAILRARITSLNHKLEKRERDGDEP